MKATPHSSQAEKDSNEIIRKLGSKLNSVALNFRVKDRADAPYLVFEVAQPNERLFAALELCMREISDNNIFKDRATISARQKTPPNRLTLPESQLLVATISESLTIDRYSFEDDFFSRYTKSVTNLEHQVTANANFLVYGRRGSGKSSLLAYAMHTLRRSGDPFAWVAMQTYAGRSDDAVTAEILADCVRQISSHSGESSEGSLLATKLDEISETDESDTSKTISKILPRVRTFFGSLVPEGGAFTLYLDDLHVLDTKLQSRLLGALYATCRGNRGYIKASGIEQFCRPWDSSRKVGLEPPHDVQLLKLDYNLTMPDRSKEHIVGILDAQARYCGLPGISFLANELALSRLVWVAAAVPRDSLSLFSAAIQKGTARGEKRVSASSVNSAASEMTESKLREIELDAGSEIETVRQTLENVRRFCVNEERQNAFLLEIRNSDPVFQNIQKLIALRLVHVLHEGITPREAGRRYMALMLDYGFYVGIRAAKSVDLFQKEPERILAKTLRKLPVYPLDPLS